VPYDGANPPKYLNGEFNAVCVQNAEGIMQAVCNGGRAEVRGGRPVRIYASAGNLNEAEWIACGGTGCVVLKATLADAPGGTTALAGVKDAPNAAMPNANYLCVDIPLSRDTPYLADGNFEGSLPAVNSETIFVLRLEAKDRMVFGEKFVLTLSPV